jgi:nitrite reductase/ring-hydroxylating ferredoxin subunit
MPFVRVLSAFALPPGSTAAVSVAGNDYALCNFNGGIYALDGVCPCSGGPLGQGVLQGNLLVCPWHGRRYDCRTGAHHFDSEVKVAVVPTRIEDGDILIDVHLNHADLQ